MSRSRRDSSVPASGVCSAASLRPSPRLFSRAAVGGGGVGCGCGFGPRVWGRPAWGWAPGGGAGPARAGGVCSGGVLLFRSLVGAVPLALGGLASGFGMVPGVSPPAVAAGTVVGLWCAVVVGPLVGGGWVGSGLRSGRGWSGSPPAPALARGRVCVGVGVCGSCRPISTGRLSPLPGLHLRPIDPVVHWGPSTTPRGGLCGDLVLEVVSRLDAFSGYPSRTWPTSGAPGGTTGAPEVRPSRSSRTGDGSPQVSCARRG